MNRFTKMNRTPQ